MPFLTEFGGLQSQASYWLWTSYR